MSQYHPILFFFQLGVLISLGLAGYCAYRLRRHGRSLVVLSVGLLAVSVAIYNGAAAMKMASPALPAKLRWYKLEFLGSGAIPSVAVTLALAYLGQERWLTWPVLGVLVGIPTVAVPLIIANPGSVMIAEPTLVEAGGLQTLEHTRPPLFVLVAAWGEGATLLAGLLVGASGLFGNARRAPALILGAALGLPYGALMLKTLQVYPPGGEGFNLTPAFASGMLILVALAIARYRLFGLLPVGRSKAFDVMSDGYVLADATGTIVDANEAARALLGEERLASRAVGAAIPELRGPGATGDPVETDSQGGAADPVTVSVEGRTLQVRSSPIRDGAAAIGRVFMLRDITPLREREQALNQVDELVSIIDGAPNDLSKATITWVNQAYAQSVGAKPEDLVGTVPWIFEELEAGSEMRTEVKDAFQTGRALRGETSRERKRGGPYFVAWHLSPVRDEEGQVTHWISVQRDVTDRKMREEELEHRATHDPLTGLLNRSAIGERVEGAIDTKGDAGALLYLDLDKFKQINDTHGHSAGDQLLKQVADVLTEALRQRDAVGRIGGDEFVVWGSSPVGRETAEQIAERIIGAFDEPFEIQGEQVAVDLSIGLVPDLSAYDTAEAALADADDAMYEAKQSLGRKFTTHDSVRPADTGS